MTDITRTLEILDRLVAFTTVSCNSNVDLIDCVQDLLITAGLVLSDKTYLKRAGRLCRAFG